MMEENIQSSLLPEELISSKIYFIRDKKVMLDTDLAELYGVKARRLREQVKRNIEKFPNHFMFQLSYEEVDMMVSQNAIPSKQHLGGALPLVFTEYGILQLANILRSDQASKMSIKIIEVFIRMREIISSHKEILIKLDQLEKKDIKQDKKIQEIFAYLKNIFDAKQKDADFKTRIPLGFKQAKK